MIVIFAKFAVIRIGILFVEVCRISLYNIYTTKVRAVVLENEQVIHRYVRNLNNKRRLSTLCSRN